MDRLSTSDTSSLNLVSTKDAEASEDKTDKAGAKYSVVRQDHCYIRLPQEPTDTSTTRGKNAVLKRLATPYVTPEPPARKVSKSSSTAGSLPGCSYGTACQLHRVVQEGGVIKVETETVSGKPGPSSSTAVGSNKPRRGKKARPIEVRRQMNRDAARKFRENTKIRLEYLQEEADNLRMQNLLLTVQNIELTDKICNTEEENRILSQLVSEKESVSKKTEFVPGYFELDDQGIFDTDDDAS